MQKKTEKRWKKTKTKVIFSTIFRKLTGIYKLSATNRCKDYIHSCNYYKVENIKQDIDARNTQFDKAMDMVQNRIIIGTTSISSLIIIYLTKQIEKKRKKIVYLVYIWRWYWPRRQGR